MSQTERARYFKIGVFTVAALSILAGGLILFGAGELFFKDEILLETYFQESVQGLEVGSPVKFRGVQVGEVKEISFVKDEYLASSHPDFHKFFHCVVVRFTVDPHNFPGLARPSAQMEIDRNVQWEGLRMKLSFLGITGLAYLDTDFVGTKAGPPMEIPWRPKHLYIPSTVNTFARLDDHLNQLFDFMDRDFYRMVENVRDSSEQFPEVTDKLHRTLAHTSVVMKNLEDISLTAKRYPSQLLFGQAPPKSRFDR